MRSTFQCLWALFLPLALGAQAPSAQSYESLNKQQEVYYKQGDYEKSLYYAELSVEAAQREANDSFYINAKTNVAAMLASLGELEQAEEMLTQVSAECLEKYGNESLLYAEIISNLSVVQIQTGRFANAEALILQALAIWKKKTGETHPNYPVTMGNLGYFYEFTGAYDKAEKTYLESIALYERLNKQDELLYTTAVNNLAGLYETMGNYAAAEKLYFRVLDIRAKISGTDHPLYVSILQNIGYLYNKIQQYDKAESYYLKAIEIADRALLPHHNERLNALNGMAVFYYGQKKPYQAQQYLDRAIYANMVTPDSSLLRKFDQWGDLAFYDNTEIIFSLRWYNALQQVQLYKLDKNQNRIDTAYAIARAALRINERVLRGFQSDADKSQVLGKAIDLIDRAILSGRKKTEVPVAELFECAEFNKSVLLLDALKGSQARSLGDLPDSLARQESNLQQSLDELQRQIAAEKDANKRIALTNQKSELDIKIQQFQQSLKDKYPRYHALRYANIRAKVSDIQGQLQEGTVFLEYYVGTANVFCFAIDPQQVHLVTLTARKDSVSALVGHLRKALTGYSLIEKDPNLAYESYVRAAHDAYQVLLRPVLDSLYAKQALRQLIVVTDGEIGHLPFEAFLTELPKEKLPYSKLPYLLNRLAINYNYSATLWKENKQNAAPKNNGKMLAFAADYKPGDRQSIRGNLAPHLRNLRDGLIELPEAKAEVEALSRAFAGTFLAGAEAKESYFKTHAADYSIVHLAMHGLLNQRSPILSSLAFTDSGDSLQDDFLEAWEISHLKLNADLVVLSACETGYGKFLQGEGVLSLARSFMYAGVPALVVSLWEVNDASTSSIMQSFYEQLAAGEDKAEALRQAKLDYIAKATNVNGHPAFWSPFVQIGDERPISVAKRGGWLLWGLLGGGLLVLLGGWALTRKRAR